MEVKEVIIIEIIVLILIGAGFFLGYQSNHLEENKYYTGCWKEVIKTNRSIAIRVDNRDIEEIIDTARHETCHEIDFRLMNYNVKKWNNKSREDKEDFAKTCIPEEYLNNTKREEL